MCLCVSGWFVLTQLIVTLVFLVELANIIIGLILWCRDVVDDKGSVRLPPIALVTTNTLITIICGKCL